MRQQIPEHMFEQCVLMSEKSFYVNESLAKFTKANIDECRRWLDSPEFAEEFKDSLERAKQLTRQEIMASTASLSEMDKRREFLDRRLEHAIKCLKRKGLYADQAEALMAVCEDRGMTDARTMLQFVRCAMGCKIMDVGCTGELDNTAWRIGIEQAMLRNEPDLCGRDSLFGPYLEPHLNDIVVNVVMTSYGCKSIRAAEGGDYDDVLYGRILERYLRDESMSDIICALLERTSGSIAEDLVQMTKKADSLEKELQSMKTQTAGQKEAIAKATAPLHARIERFDTERSELEQELSALRSENEALSNALSDRDKKLSELSGLLGQDDLPELPDSGVIFVGGHVNMVKKFMHGHPGWTFIDGRDVNFAEFRNPVLIFFWDKHLSHPTWHRVKKLAPPGAPQAYLKSTNIEMLEQEMRQAWAAVKPDGPA